MADLSFAIRWDLLTSSERKYFDELGIKVHASGIEFTAKPDIDDFKRVLSILSKLEKRIDDKENHIAFAIGDALNAGERFFGKTDLLATLKSAVNEFQIRKDRAKTRLKEFEKGWCFGLIGFNLLGSKDYGNKDSLFQIRHVEEPPNVFELAEALSDRSILATAFRYVSGIKHELVLNPKLAKNDQACFNFAWWIISAIRVKTIAEFLVPAATDTSWSTIAGCETMSVRLNIIEDYPQSKKYTPTTQIKQEELDWVEKHLTNFVQLLEVPNFRIAVELLTTHAHHAAERMTLVFLWAAFEAIFQIDSELRFKLAAYCSAFLESYGPTRYELFKELKKRYDIRSKAVHGVALKADRIVEEIISVRSILSRIVCKITEKGAMPLAENFEKELFDVNDY